MGQLIQEVKFNSLRTSTKDGYVLVLNEAEKIKKLENPSELVNKTPYTKELKDKIKNVLKFNSLNHIKLPNADRKLNANESSILREQLTVSIGDNLKTWYIDNTARLVFPFRKTPSPFARTLKYVMKEYGGKAKVITNGDPNDMPIVSRKGTPYYSPVFELRLGARYDLSELEAAAMGLEPLETDLLDATREGHERAINDIAFGIGATDDPNTALIPGLFNQPTRCILSSDDSNLANDNMLTNSATENRDYLLNIISTPYNFTKKRDTIPTVLVMPVAQVNLINKQPLSTDNTETVASFILRTTSIKKIVASPECESVGLNSITDALFCFNDSEQARICEVQETLPYTPGETDKNLYTFTIPTRSKTGGLFVFRKAIALVKNCG